jgi:allantoate deiminase
MAKIAKIGLIFIPSKNGRSHVPEEFTSFEDIKIGCDILLNTVLEMDAIPKGSEKYVG